MKNLFIGFSISMSILFLSVIFTFQGIPDISSWDPAGRALLAVIIIFFSLIAFGISEDLKNKDKDKEKNSI